MQDAGGCLGHLHEHGLGVPVLLNGAGHFLGGDGGAPFLLDFSDLEASHLGDLAPALAELAGVDHDDRVAGVEEAVDGGGHGAGSGAGERQHGLGRAEEQLQLLLGMVHDLVEFALAVVDHVLGQSQADAFGQGGGAGGEKARFIDHVGRILCGGRGFGARRKAGIAGALMPQGGSVPCFEKRLNCIAFLTKRQCRAKGQRVSPEGAERASASLQDGACRACGRRADAEARPVAAPVLLR